MVEGNFLGVDPSGTLAGTNQGQVVGINNQNNGRIGTNADGVNDLAERNLISGGTYGVNLSGGIGYVVAGNLVGTDVTGTRAIPNGPLGIHVRHEDFLVGGTSEVARNVVSGNTGFGGISINNVGDGPGGKVQGNFVGVDVSGIRPLGNRGYGIGSAVTGATTTRHTLVGGTEPGARNIVSANTANGINLSNSGTVIAAPTVQGNYIGTDVTGMLDLGNGQNGLFLRGPGHLIGGSAPGAGNLISGNGQNGLVIGDTAVPTSGTRVEGNRIGVNAAGTGFLGNSQNGVWINGTATSNLVGGTATGAANIIAGNSLAGVRVSGGTGNSIRGNSIYSNGELGIDLGSTVVTANDAGDPDTDPNLRQNYPVLTSASAFAGGTYITGSLNSTSNTTFHLDLYSNAAADPSGFGEGQTYLGSAVVVTDATGNVSFSVSVPGIAAAGTFVSATATAPNGNTSEFSAVATGATFVPATIHGTKFNDLNGNGTREAGEPGIANWTITLDAGADGSIDATTSTNSSGDYSFGDLGQNTYRVREIQQPGWTQTSADPADIVVSASAQTFAGVDFGNRQTVTGDCEATITAGLVSCWTGDGDALDHWDGNDGTMQNGATFAPGLFHQAFHFDGVDDYMHVPQAVNLQFGPSDPMTVSLWAYRTSANDVQHVFGKRSGCGGGSDFYQIAFDSGGIVFGSGAWTQASSGSALPMHTWTHILGTYDGSAYRLYVNGVLAGSIVTPAGIANAAPVTVGTSGSCGPFGGLLDEILVYNRALSADEIEDGPGGAGSQREPHHRR